MESYVPFCVGLISLRIVFNVYSCGSVYQYFFSFNGSISIPLQGYSIFCLAIHHLIDIWVVSIFWLLWMQKYLCVGFCYGYMSSIFLLCMPRSEIDDHVVTLCFTFWEIIRSAKVTAPFCIPTSNAWGL